MSEELEMFYGMFSDMGKQALFYKNKSEDTYDKFINVCKERDRITISSDLELSHNKMKINLVIYY